MQKDDEMWVGNIGVDSGQVMIGDPCYWLPEEYNLEGKKTLVPPIAAKQIGENLYHEVCERSLKAKFGTLDGTYISLGAFSSTGWGDGEYPVYAKLGPEGRVASLRIEFIDTDE